MSILTTLIERARKNPKVIVLPEGQDPRVVAAANKAVEEKVVAKAVVLGSEAELAEACAKAGFAARNFETIDYLNSGLFNDFAAEFCKMREKKGMTPEKAAATMKSRIYFGAMMCRRGLADGLVAGSIASTADMLRAAFHCIGTAPGIKIASSCFVMDLKSPTPSGDDVLLFADCGVNPNPNAQELVDIALATSATYRSLLGGQPKVAFLSFSTRGSADHEILNKVKEAATLMKEKIEAEKLDIVAKAPGSPLAGGANILIFPDLNAGNIGYKLVQRLAKADAYGPILQGLAKPLNDLSRGCVSEDIFGQIVITVCQAK